MISSGISKIGDMAYILSAFRKRIINEPEIFAFVQILIHHCGDIWLCEDMLSPATLR